MLTGGIVKFEGSESSPTLIAASVALQDGGAFALSGGVLTLDGVAIQSSNSGNSGGAVSMECGELNMMN
eukprot:2135155-Prymnesium_polylepis.1